MNNLRASAIVYVLVGLAFLAIFLLAPYPHYDYQKNAWYSGPSVMKRLVGEADPGIPLEQVFSKVTKAAITSPFNLECSVNSDCTSYTIINQCLSYCGNLEASNKAAQTQLNNNRVCDPSVSSAAPVKCACVQGKCINLN